MINKKVILKKLSFIKPFIKLIFFIIKIPQTIYLVRTALNKKNISLEIGAGNKKGNEKWITLDNSIFADICWDLRFGIPFPNNSLNMIYSSHCFEHIPFTSLNKLIITCHKKLKKGGKLSLSVPNARLYIESYLKKNTFLDLSKQYKPAISDTGSFIDQVNYIAYMGGEHNYMFDEENLRNILIKNGFSNVILRSFDQEIDPFERDFESIYVIAEKA